MSEENRHFTDDDLQRLIELFWQKVQQEIGKGILKGVWGAVVAAAIGAFALGMAIKFKVIGIPQ